MINTCRKHDFNGETVLVMHTADECPVCALLVDLDADVIDLRDAAGCLLDPGDADDVSDRVSDLVGDLEALDVYRTKPAPVTS